MHVEDPAVAPIQACTTDISANGVGILSPVSLRIGEQILLTFDDGPLQSLHYICTVIHSNSISPGQYRIGARLACTIDRNTLSPADPAETERIRKALLNE